MSVLCDCEIPENFELQYLSPFFLQESHQDSMQITSMQKEVMKH